LDVKTRIQVAGGDTSNEAYVREGIELAVQKGLNVVALHKQREEWRSLSDAAMTSADSLAETLAQIREHPLLCGYLLGVDFVQVGPNVREFGKEQENEAQRRLGLLFELLQTISTRAHANPGGMKPVAVEKGRKRDRVAAVMCRVLLIQILERCPFPFRDAQGRTSRLLVAVFEAVLAAGHPNNRDDDRLAAQRVLRRELPGIEQSHMRHYQDSD
jgi:hypothetical protein